MSEIEEVAKTTGKAIDATREAGGFLAQFLKGPLEQASGISEDYLRYVRAVFNKLPGTVHEGDGSVGDSSFASRRPAGEKICSHTSASRCVAPEHRIHV